jgi:hypothetical protein
VVVVLVVGEAFAAEGGMQPGAVIPGDVLDHGPPCPARLGEARVSMSSPISEEKKLSARAMAQH